MPDDPMKTVDVRQCIRRERSLAPSWIVLCCHRRAVESWHGSRQPLITPLLVAFWLISLIRIVNRPLYCCLFRIHTILCILLLCTWHCCHFLLAEDSVS
ncbi:hypothetical protein GDO78_023163 [Eleutherodactylus coqui]|uniref:Uncharacterized protein n=1 Tax=Eleutherodactylus coqui TaxID=57060 RepID=A0A8J6BM57_ELECQ|nr:hypothetical protein GDO78_023163 [Eleutherodactylus coqui]